MNPGILLLVHAAAAWFMTGLIWLVQVGHYPLLARVGAAGYRDYHLARQSLITLIAGPAMLVELAAAVLLLFHRRDPWTLAGVALLAVIWSSTALLQTPLHNALSTGFDPESRAPGAYELDPHHCLDGPRFARRLLDSRDVSLSELSGALPSTLFGTRPGATDGSTGTGRVPIFSTQRD